MDDVLGVAEKFTFSGKITKVCDFGNGNINKTYLATLDSEREGHFILQRINTQVFHKPELIMENMQVITGHISERLRHSGISDGRRWEVPRIIVARDGKDHWIDSDGSFWRAISYIDNARTFDTIKDIRHAEETGYALGMFHNLISDLSPARLVDTLEGFHILPRYLQHYDEVLRLKSIMKSQEVDYCLQFVDSRSARSHILERARSEGKLLLRPIHGDPKVNNIMIDNVTGHAVGMVDLDTVKPGLVHYDIGDCLRSGCNPLGEETENWEMVRFEPDLCEAILRGYITVARQFLTLHDYDYLYDAVRLIAFELGLRFFTDYLEGNVYFKVKHPEQNLARALVQFRLVESIESRKETISSIVSDLRCS
ncbi:MAG: aminoglycoside phosphotransferase [Nitrospira bacterium SG8_35_4]|nr:MAG: aminoglycoside phosphotransferase [Nitrospira bacterium SG8_35_4]